MFCFDAGTRFALSCGGNEMRILIADDHAVVRQGLETILAEGLPHVEVGEAENAQEVLQLVREKDWDLLVLDIAMPGRSGLDVLKQLRSTHPTLPVLVLSVYPEDEYAVRVLRAGAAGYLNKESAPDELVRAAEKVLAGGKYASASLAEKLVLDLSGGAKEEPHEDLSDRELLVMRMIASGKTVTEIARELSLSVKSISTYRGRALGKMGMKTNVELTRYALEKGLVN